MKEMKFYGTALPEIEIEPYTGKLIVIEGTDGVGRSTHVALLRTWLESAGYAVLDTGMTRSVLAGRGIKNARTGHTLGRLTMQLYYATDFHHRRCAGARRRNAFTQARLAAYVQLGVARGSIDRSIA
ncbi:MAG TPA: hypothetical protein VE863_18330 [Pyrinomonadaceae bacterium]|jgi:dTMP kinase|nr:hypothetical protein [Pyrinomonadaceae bacterium]